MENLYQQFAEKFEKSRKVLMISHRKPDGDTLGASSALFSLCRQKGKEATMACVDKASDRFQFLVGIDEIVHEFNYEDYDLIMVSDAGAHYMTNYHEIYPDIFSGKVPVVNIDHHVSNDNFGTLNIVDTNSASTTIVLYKMFKNLGYQINIDMATSLLAGIYNDTGSFMHSNTDGEVYQIASELLSLGASLGQIVQSMFQNNHISTLKLWGRALDNIQLTSDGVAMSVVTEEDFKELNAHPEQLSGVIDYLNAVPGAKFSLLLSEDGEGNVKGSLRTQREDIDVAEIASEMGGGGHSKASGFSFPGELKRELKYTIVSKKDPCCDLGAAHTHLSSELQVEVD